MTRIASRLIPLALLALTLTACNVQFVFAQGSWLQAPDVGFISLGVSNVSTGELDDELTAYGYPTFGQRAIRPSIGAYWDLPGAVLLGGEWHGIMLSEEPHAGGEVGLGGGYVTLGVGHAIDLSPRARIYPRLGLGFGGLGLWIEPDEDDGKGPPVGFDDALEDPSPGADRDFVMSRTHGAVDLGAGAEVMLGTRRGLLVGIRAGYLAAPFQSDWELPLEDRPVTGGPSATVAGPYVQVVVGGGRRR